MSEVKRYAFKLTAISSICGGRIELVEYTGEGMPYVLASDYDQLKDELDRSRIVLGRIDSENSQIKAENAELKANLCDSLADSMMDVVELKAENERLARVIRYEQHLADRIGTHGPDCWSWGNAHYECLKRKHQQDVGESTLERDTLRKQLAKWTDVFGHLGDTPDEIGNLLITERDTLRKQLDEAMELLEECSDMADACEDQVLLGHIDAWLEANK